MALAATQRDAHHRVAMQTHLERPTVPAHEAPARRVAVEADDAVGAAQLRDALRTEGLTADESAHEVPDALVMLVSRGLPERLARLRELRQLHPATPFVVACRSLRELDQVLALETGADDVVDAAWSPPVLAARLRALWRRGRPYAGIAADVLRFGALTIRHRERQVQHAGREVPLTEGEFEVLWLLAAHAGNALSRRDILKAVRGLDDQPLDRSIDSRVYRIRAKLGDNGGPCQRIRTVRNRGYLFSPAGW
jgi:two-component system, OmpR family, response regulator RstA